MFIGGGNQGYAGMYYRWNRGISGFRVQISHRADSGKGRAVFPVRTFAINIVGAFVIGMIAALAAKNSVLNPKAVLFLKVGICGGFTTFSSFALETSDLLKSGHLSAAALYAVLSIVLGILAAFAGEAVAG